MASFIRFLYGAACLVFGLTFTTTAEANTPTCSDFGGTCEGDEGTVTQACWVYIRAESAGRFEWKPSEFTEITPRCWSEYNTSNTGGTVKSQITYKQYGTPRTFNGIARGFSGVCSGRPDRTDFVDPTPGDGKAPIYCFDGCTYYPYEAQGGGTLWASIASETQLNGQSCEGSGSLSDVDFPGDSPDPGDGGGGDTGGGDTGGGDTGGGDTGGGDTGGTDGSTVTGGATCSTAPVCTGDAATCAIVRQTWETRCAVERLGESTTGDGTGTGGTGSSTFDLQGWTHQAAPDDWIQDDPEAISIGIGPDDFDDSGFGLPRNCPVWGSFEIIGVMVPEFTLHCDLFRALGALILVFVYLQAARMVASIGT